MIGSSMLYCALWALWLSAAAWGIERLMLRGRGPVRAVWICAIALSVIGPLFGYALSRRSSVSAVSVTAASLASSHSIERTANAPVVHRSAQSHSIAERFAGVRAAVARADRALGIAWLALSLALLVYIAGGLVHLSFVRRRWRASVVNGTRVMISENSGPALVGVVKSTIVIPEWALSLEPDALALMLRHELEHQSAGDTRMLAAAEMLLMLMPWSPMLWWQLRRLRLAIELDCDARVLRSVPDVHSYGRLLLEFGRQRREMHFAGAALADHAANLEVRIRRMTRRPAMSRGKAAGLLCIAGMLAIVVGCQLPAPTPPAPKAKVAAKTAEESRTDSTVLAEVTKYDQLLTRFDTFRLRDRTREQTIESDRLLNRLLRDTEQEYLELKLSDSTARVPLIQSYVDMRLEMNRLAQRLEQFTPAATDSMRGLQEKLLAMTRGLDSIGQQSRALNFTPGEMLRFYRDGQPLMSDSLYFKTDAEAAEQLAAGCSSSMGVPGSSLVKLLVSNAAAANPGSITFSSAAPTEIGTQLDAAGLMCRNGGSGELRLYGRAAFDGSPITIRTNAPMSVVVVTGSGRVLAGPIVVQNEHGRYDLTWAPR
jgi:beta-lactamase regulating signal transducer with metallopeptidase domain